ncbi:helix-turn-helix domain-containing protein [Gordonia soli]|nr:MerR family DNA-binding transcriptional regulator [Gordonia soli]
MTQQSATIGDAAALFGIAPSTVRWWERQGVLPDPSRSGGRRVYDATELRRIGLAYLCSVTGSMPLERTASVTVGNRHAQWQSVIRDHAAVIDATIEELLNARAYLVHLLLCTDDDMATNCPHLDDELRRHTPRGRIAESDLVAAAMFAGRQTDRLSTRDDMSGVRDEMGPGPDAPSCASCGSPVERSARGRPRKYCSQACRQRRYRQTVTSR